MSKDFGSKIVLSKLAVSAIVCDYWRSYTSFFSDFSSDPYSNNFAKLSKNRRAEELSRFFYSDCFAFLFVLLGFRFCWERDR